MKQECENRELKIGFSDFNEWHFKNCVKLGHV